MSPVSGSALVTNNFLQGLLDRFGVRGIYQFFMRDNIQPVAVVDGSIQAIGLQTLDIPFTAGEITAPAANTRLANTGALTKGQYNLTVWIDDPEGMFFHVRRRNAGDTADIWAQRFTIGSGTVQRFPLLLTIRLVIQQNEFVVVENIAVGSAGLVYQVNIWVQGPF